MSEIKDYFNIDDNDHNKIYTTFWRAQTFTASSNYTIGSVKLYLFKATGTTPGILTASIRNTSSGKPTGEDLCVGTTNANTLPESSVGYEWREIFFTSSYSTVSGTMYAIVLRLNVDAEGVYWRKKVTSGYGGGTRVTSSNCGESWSSPEAGDYLFETWTALVYKDCSSTIALSSQISASLDKYIPYTWNEFIPPRPPDYNPSLFWSEDYKQWIGIDKGGSRYKTNLVVIGQNDNSQGVIYYGMG